MAEDGEKPKRKNSAKKWGIVIITAAAILAITLMRMRGLLIGE
jgi:hypothetical protein